MADDLILVTIFGVLLLGILAISASVVYFLLEGKCKQNTRDAPKGVVVSKLAEKTKTANPKMQKDVKKNNFPEKLRVRSPQTISIDESAEAKPESPRDRERQTISVEPAPICPTISELAKTSDRSKKMQFSEQPSGKSGNERKVKFKFPSHQYTDTEHNTKVEVNTIRRFEE
ncbi:hypothetical protein M3Y98_01203800 [Aphelenchoides besseyi]|nr:hypothetical protein M3Y98_01203800 [Aphelenchoides besseyi]KAI6193086.1 hypothetical protein M3Y96_00980800 [Aphelenchoides besseyi]